MGSSLSPVIANIFMEHFETLALNNFHQKPKCWFRFVDDTFVIWPHGQVALGSLLEHLNNLSTYIKFTMETQIENAQRMLYPFLMFL